MAVTSGSDPGIRGRDPCSRGLGRHAGGRLADLPAPKRLAGSLARCRRVARVVSVAPRRVRGPAVGDRTLDYRGARRLRTVCRSAASRHTRLAARRPSCGSARATATSPSSPMPNPGWSGCAGRSDTDGRGCASVSEPVRERGSSGSLVRPAGVLPMRRCQRPAGRRLRCGRWSSGSRRSRSW
jgi:hypothetical protein